jgi:hypothetical protein
MTKQKQPENAKNPPKERKAYEKPQIEQVNLVPEQAVLSVSGCKVGNGNNYDGGHGCMATMCSSASF